MLNKLQEYLGISSDSNEFNEKLLKFLLESCPEWRGYVQTITVKGSKWGIQLLTEFKDIVVAKLHENKELVSEVSRFATKTGGRIIITKLGAKYLGMAAVKSATNPVAIFADAAQGACEYIGQKRVGKAIGITGNMASAAAFGFMAGGPVGAASGAVVGAGMWFTGEIVGAWLYKWTS